jgi:16S rRNA (adenine1518-N6/adenine1519-N6)-dimethyltransferase
MGRPRRRFGQHFLTNPRLLDRIAEALAPECGDPVLEIGPGRGALTEALLRRGARVTAIEIDRDLVPLLRDRFPQVQVAEGDALALDWNEVVAPERPGAYLLSGNIPYNITSPLLDKALTPPRPRRIVFLVQKEVADRVTAHPNTSEYGALTVGVQSVAHAERLFTVPAGAFHPPPRVDSAVIRLVPRAEPLIPDALVGSFRRMVTGLFSFRRKQLICGLRELTGWPAEQVAALLEQLDLDPSHRPEVLSPEEFAALHRRLVDEGWRAG